MGGVKDWQLIETILLEEYTFVTNNRADFVSLYRRQELHPGLVIIVPNVAPVDQRLLFQAALTHIGRRDLVNTVVETDRFGSEIRCSEYPLPVE